MAFQSNEPLRFLEIRYTGGKESDRPFGLVGKGEKRYDHDLLPCLSLLIDG